MTTDARELFRALIAESIGLEPECVTLFAKGRVALYAILRALDVGPGDEVILPAFTCVAVPNAILYAGARPVWVDIDPITLCIDPAAVEAAVGPRTRVVIAQNTFGLSADLDAIHNVARTERITVVDDCAHGLGGRYGGKPNGATAAMSFFSTQWSKPVSTGLGGFAVDVAGRASGRLRSLEDGATEPSPVRDIAIRALLYGRARAGGGRLFRQGRSVYRALGRRGFVPGSSSQDELDGPEMPRNFLMKLSNSQARTGVERLRRLPAEIERRRSIAHRYSELLFRAGRTAAAEPADAEHAFLRYPLRVVDRRRFSMSAEQAGVDVGDWFISPVHPVTSRLQRWGYVPGCAPNAEQACREIVNLPTEPSLQDGEVDRILSFLAKHLDQIV